MNIPLERAEARIEVKKSRFLAIAEPVESQDQVRSLVQHLRTLHPDASHVVHAAVLGKQGDQFSMSDDHEPKNTAGRPVLEVLKGSGITNTAVCIVRWFGGTLLGTGGLVKAYSDAAKAVIELLRTEELIEKSKFSVEIGYDLYEQAKQVLTAHHAVWIEDFSSSIQISGTLPASNTDALAQGIANLSSGSCQVLFS